MSERNLPTVELVAGDLYWIKRAYKDPERWTVARWEHGAWWDIDGREATPRIICGPIPRPAENGPSGRQGSEANTSEDGQLWDEPLPTPEQTGKEG